MNQSQQFQEIKQQGLLLTCLLPEGSKITVRFLKQRMRDYMKIKREIIELEAEVNGVAVQSKIGEQR